MAKNRFRANFQYLTNRLGWSYISLIVFWFCLRLVFFDQLWWLALLNTIAFYLFIPLVLLLPLGILLSQRHLIMGLTIPIAIFVGLFSQVLLPSFSTPDLVPQNAFKIMTFNILWSNQNYAQIGNAIQIANPDIVGFEEVRPPNIVALTAALPAYPYSSFHQSDEYHTVGIVSRFPIVSTAQLPNPPIERGLQAVIDVNGKWLTVVVAHLAPNNMPLFPPSEFVKQTKERYARRADEIELLKQTIQNRNYPTVIVCDCNMTDTSQTYDQLQAILTDSFVEAGWGLGHTLTVKPVPFPVQRVDYVWHTADLQAVNAYVGGNGGSDHHSMVANLQFVQK